MGKKQTCCVAGENGAGEKERKGGKKEEVGELMKCRIEGMKKRKRENQGEGGKRTQGRKNDVTVIFSPLQSYSCSFSLFDLFFHK